MNIGKAVIGGASKLISKAPGPSKAFDALKNIRTSGVSNAISEVSKPINNFNNYKIVTEGFGSATGTNEKNGK